MRYVNGDLIKKALAGDYDVIVHGCNCFNTMGAGIALQIANQIPIAYTVDKSTKSGDKSKLGDISIAQDGELTIINGYTQFGFRRGERACDYHAIRSVFKKIKKLLGGKSLKFGIPKIGAGLAGGDWSIIVDIIDGVMGDENIETVIYSG